MHAGIIQTRPVDTFTLAYIEAALWASSCEEEPHPDRSLTDAGYTAEDIDLETLDRMIFECATFQVANAEHIGTRWENAGHDFWLTRNGHGAGFWDGDWPEPAATILDEASKRAGERDLYVGDDGRIYQYQG